MLINTLNILTETSLYLLLFGMTFSNSATEIFAVMIIVFFIIRRALLKNFASRNLPVDTRANFKPPKTPVNLILYIICAVVFITFLRSVYFSESVRGFLRVIKFIILFFALTEFFCEDEKRIRRTFWAIMAVACFTFLNGIFQSIYGFDLLRHHEAMKVDYMHRVMASFVHPNDFGAYVIFILPLTFCFFAKRLKKPQRISLMINCLLGAYCLFNTSSRSAWLGFLVGITVYFFFYKKKMSIIVPFVAVLFILATPHSFEHIRSLFTSEHNTVWERIELWKGTWNMVKVHPVLGFGINTFSRYFPKYKPSEYWGIMYAHNSYLQMWSEIGVLGLLSYLALIFTVLIKALRGMREKVKDGFEGLVLLGAISGYAAFLVQAGLDTNLYSLVLTTLFWVMSAYILAINKILERKLS